MIPELDSLDAPQGLLRIPPEMDVPISPRVMRIIDSEAMRRLSRVSQLGLVSLVYPGAVHSRFEHSLGVYRNGLLVLKHLARDRAVDGLLDVRAAEALVLASLLHDCGHWPFCHPIEDMELEEVPKHESRARRLIEGPELSRLISADWNCSAEDVLRILEGKNESPKERFLTSILSGPIDIDKLDYLTRDSLHAGVPYGRNFDVGRLVNSFCLHPDSNRLAITGKGRTAAEMMVFARYVMFSEVYWHHAVRSATAMLQRAVWLLRERLDLPAMFDLDDAGWTTRLCRAAEGTLAEPLTEGLFGKRRNLLKRIAQFGVLDQPAEHRWLAHKPYASLATASDFLAGYLSKKTGLALTGADVIIDAPPVKLEVDIRVDVVEAGRAKTAMAVRTLGEVSPVVNVLAKKQFDGYVKRVRVFVREDIRRKVGFLGAEHLREALNGSGFDLS